MSMTSQATVGERESGVQELQNGLSGRTDVFQLTGELAICILSMNMEKNFSNTFLEAHSMLFSMTDGNNVCDP